MVHPTEGSASSRRAMGGPWSGLDLGAYARSDVPPGAIHRVDGVAFVIKIPKEIYAASAERLIDVDPAAPSKFVLR